MGKISHQLVMPPSPAISSGTNDASIARSHGAASQLTPTLPTESTVDRMDFAPKHSHELSRQQLESEVKATQRRIEGMEPSLHAKISDLREEIRAKSPRRVFKKQRTPR